MISTHVLCDFAFRCDNMDDSHSLRYAGDHRTIATLSCSLRTVQARRHCSVKNDESVGVTAPAVKVCHVALSVSRVMFPHALFRRVGSSQSSSAGVLAWRVVDLRKMNLHVTTMTALVAHGDYFSIRAHQPIKREEATFDTSHTCFS